MTTYDDIIAAKKRRHLDAGIEVDGDLHPALFDYQRDVVRWALRKGKACLFEDCGLGKTLQQLVWASHVPGRVIVVAPLAVSTQTLAEAQRFGIDAIVSRDGDAGEHITITNYERLHHFDPHDFAGIVLDESSIIKNQDGKTRQAIMAFAAHIPYRLACTATPAPNDHMELGNHAEFVGASTATEMLATYFVHDGGDTSKWRLKGHAKADFWAWVATWAVMMRRPSDLGYPSEGYELPALVIHEHVLESGIKDEGSLFTTAALSLTDQRRARRATLEGRADHVAELVNEQFGEQWIVWCELNDEGDALVDAIVGAEQVSGADTDEQKADKLQRFTRGEIRVLVTKPKIAGFGMNWQHVANMAFVGLSHSWEQFYQAVRRSWRFGQKRDVNVHIVSTDREVAVLENIKRKQADADEMAAAMVDAMAGATIAEIKGSDDVHQALLTQTVTGNGWTMHLGDCVKSLKEHVKSDSVGYTVFSPPFASLYTYTSNDHDMGNCKDDAEFLAQFGYLVDELYRVTMPGRLLSFHCMLLPSTKVLNGYIGLRDFRGDLIRAFVERGWIHHSEVVIWKDPVTSMQRTKALGLLHKTIRKDSAMSRQGIPDYLVTMRKPGANPDPIPHGDDLPVELWQQYASPVWMDVNPSRTLQYRSAREHDDEKHICPLQLDVIERAMHLWSKPGDLVLSPFGGIGSEGHVALTMGRRFVGCELKESYFRQACRNLQEAAAQPSLF